MTTGKALQVLRFQLLKSYVRTRPGLQEATELAIEALTEKLEREKGGEQSGSSALDSMAFRPGS